MLIDLLKYANMNGENQLNIHEWSYTMDCSLALADDIIYFHTNKFNFIIVNVEIGTS